VIRFMRKLDVRTWRVLFESRRTVMSDASRPFRSLAAEDLSIDGYVRQNHDGSVDYFAPDADVLLSETFLTDHCFRVVSGLGRELHENHIGLGFEPVPKRTTPDIRGVLWLDAKTAELRTLEFTYTWLPYDERTKDFGGVVDFFRTLGGQWIVRNWRIRTPEFGHEQYVERANGERIAMAPSRTPHVVRITEEGGAVPLGVLLAETAVRGVVVMDKASQRAIPGVTVALGGTNDSTVTDEFGRFALTEVDVGSYTLVLRHPALDSLGIEFLGSTVDVRPGVTSQLVIEFPSNADLARRLCDGPVNLERDAVVRVIAVDDSTGKPLRDAPIVISQPGAALRRGMLDAGGGFVVCGASGGQGMVIQIGNGPIPFTDQVIASAGVVGWRLIRVKR
jgi:hypothetical protein